ncbi:MAG: hypothetical protein JNN01_07580 [Opitutaceae bacterium]|nr:hypothetical protein [Opitutaceae bacterium]
MPRKHPSNCLAIGRLAAAGCRTIVLIGMSATAFAGKGYLVTIAAAPVERAGIVVRFQLPSDGPASPALRDPSAQEVPLQIGGDREVCFTLAELKAGESRVFRLVDGGRPSAPGVRAHKKEGALEIETGTAPVLAY